MNGFLRLDPADIIFSLVSSTRDEVLEELSRLVTEKIHALSADDLARRLLERENLGSTGIGEGVALPHCKSPELTAPVILFGRSSRGVEFNALDGKPVHLFFVLLAPDGADDVHLNLLARISRILKVPAIRSRLMEASDAREIDMIISELDSIL